MSTTFALVEKSGVEVTLGLKVSKRTQFHCYIYFYHVSEPLFPYTPAEHLYMVQVSTTRQSTKIKDRKDYLDTNV